MGAVSLAQHVADTTHNGYLSSTDWNTFSAKQPAGNYITALTGDGTASGPGSAALTLATVNANVGSFGAADTVSTFTVTGKGLITAAGSASIQIAESQVTGLVTDLASKVAISSLGNLTDAGTDGITVTGGTAAVVGSVSLSQHVADTTHNGYLSSTDWNTFNSKQAALTLGNLTDTGTDGITVTGGTGAVVGSGTSISQQVADATHNGYLSSTDWSTFNGKGVGTVTAVSVASANGLAGSSSGGATPALTLSTTITGILQGNGTAISAASTNGSGAVVLTTSAALVTPDLGTPSAGVLTHATGLPLSSGVTGQLPIANGGTGQATASAAFDALSPMTTGGDLIYGGASGTGTRLANGSSGQFLKSNGTTLAPTWSAVTASPGAIQTKTTTYQILTSDYMVLCSGSAFTATLPAATGSGITIRIQKTDSSLTNIITVKGSGAETINGANTTTLNTQYEEVVVIDIGSGTWSLAQRNIVSVWDSTLAFTILSFGTVTGQSVFSKRIGDTMFVRGVFAAGTVTGSSAAVQFPSGIAIDTAKVTATANIQSFGYAYREDNSGSQIDTNSPVCMYYDGSTTNQLQFATTTNSNTFVVAAANVIIGGGQRLSFEFNFPVSGWNG